MLSSPCARRSHSADPHSSPAGWVGGDRRAVERALNRVSMPPHRLSADGDLAARDAAALAAPSLMKLRIATTASHTPRSPKDLVSLSLCRLGLAAVPEAVFALTKLQVLDVSHNQIETLPDGIGTGLK